MTDQWLLTIVISIPLVYLAVFDLQVARELRAADYQPSIPFLGLVKGIVYGVTGAAILAVVLAIASGVFLVWGVRVLPPPIGFLMLYAICISASLAVYRLRQWIRRQ